MQGGKGAASEAYRKILRSEPLPQPTQQPGLYRSRL